MRAKLTAVYQHRVFPILLFTSLTFLLHAGALKNLFYWDDRPLIVNGQRISSWKYLPELFSNELWYNVDLGKQAPTTKVDTYRPMLNASFLVDYQWTKLDPYGYHLTNLGIHIVACLLLFLIAKCFIPRFYALFGATLFCIHPLTSECIEYIAARSDSLMFLFFLSALYFGLRKTTWTSVLFCCLSFLFSCFVKETALMLPLVLTLFCVQRKKSAKELFVLASSIGATLAVYFGLRFMALRGAKAVRDARQIFDFLLHFPKYVLRTFFDFVRPNRVMPMEDFVLNFSAVTAIFLLFCMVFVLIAYRKKLYFLLCAFLSSILVLAPPFMAVSLTTVTNPRYQYASIAFLSVFAAALLFLLHERHLPEQLEKISWSIVFLLFLSLSKGASEKYRTEELFYRNILAQNPHHTEAEYNLANTYYRAGKFRDAIIFYKEALTHQPDNPSTLNNLGTAYLNIGDNLAAREAISRALTLDPTNQKYKNNLTLTLESNR